MTLTAKLVLTAALSMATGAAVTQQIMVRETVLCPAPAPSGDDAFTKHFFSAPAPALRGWPKY
jgi:hypothetical protein